MRFNKLILLVTFLYCTSASANGEIDEINSLIELGKHAEIVVAISDYLDSSDSIGPGQTIQLYKHLFASHWSLGEIDAAMEAKISAEKIYNDIIDKNFETYPSVDEVVKPIKEVDNSIIKLKDLFGG